MDYWHGVMNWPINPNWVCEICGGFHGMTWGLVHAECRCNNCHTQYMMRDGQDIVIYPICLLKPEYRQPAKLGFEMYQRPFDEWTDDEWDEAIEKCQVLLTPTLELS